MHWKPLIALASQFSKTVKIPVNDKLLRLTLKSVRWKQEAPLQTLLHNIIFQAMGGTVLPQVAWM